MIFPTPSLFNWVFIYVGLSWTVAIETGKIKILEIDKMLSNRLAKNVFLFWKKNQMFKMNKIVEYVLSNYIL